MPNPPHIWSQTNAPSSCPPPPRHPPRGPSRPQDSADLPGIDPLRRDAPGSVPPKTRNPPQPPHSPCTTLLTGVLCAPAGAAVGLLPGPRAPPPPSTSARCSQKDGPGPSDPRHPPKRTPPSLFDDDDDDDDALPLPPKVRPRAFVTRASALPLSGPHGACVRRGLWMRHPPRAAADRGPSVACAAPPSVAQVRAHGLL